MEMDLVPVRVITSGGPADGRLIYANKELVAVLVKLDADLAVEVNGEWFLEAGFGAVQGLGHLVFIDLNQATMLITNRLNSDGDGLAERLGVPRVQPSLRPT